MFCWQYDSCIGDYRPSEYGGELCLCQPFFQERTQSIQIKLHGVLPAMDLGHAYTRHHGLVQFVKQERTGLFGNIHMSLGHFFRVALHIQLKDIYMRRIGIYGQLIEL